MPTPLKSGLTLLFVGDSITDCGRSGAQAPLGWGYVKLFSDLLTLREPEKRVYIVNKGIGGNTVADLDHRWTDDVLFYKPDWLSIKIGINDLHRSLPGSNDRYPVSPEAYERHYTAILERTRAALPRCRLLLIDPFYISTDRAPGSPRAKVLDFIPRYLAVVEKLGRRFRARRVHTHALFQRLLRYHPADVFCPEPVHPNGTGHLAIAEAVYQSLSRT